MKYYLKDWRQRIHKIEYSSREKLRTDLTDVALKLRDLYREKLLNDEVRKSIVNRLMNMSDKDANSVHTDSMITEAEHIQAIMDELYVKINNNKMLVSDIDSTQKIDVSSFLGTGYSFKLPEIYEENIDELCGLIDSIKEW